ncbi:MAG: cyclase family protein [Nitrososphaerota archaeon]|nr:cyclase family protein [Nitrososphaerota archaeon]
MTSLDTPVFPGYPQPLRSTFTTVRDNGYASFIWTFAEHSSTHVDSPAHFIEGAYTIDKVPINRYVGKGIVLDFTKVPPRYSITKEDISSRIEKSGRKVGRGWMLLFHTGYTEKSRTNEWMNHPELSDEACKYIVSLEVNAVGFDAPSPDHEPFPAHKILLPKVISVYENLTNLDKLLNKDFLFVGAPLALTGGSACPVRAVALVS